MAEQSNYELEPMIRELVDFAGVGVSVADAMVSKGGELLLLEVCDGIPRILSVLRSLDSTVVPPRTMSKTIRRKHSPEFQKL